LALNIREERVLKAFGDEKLLPWSLSADRRRSTNDGEPVDMAIYQVGSSMNICWLVFGDVDRNLCEMFIRVSTLLR
jgi:hypothetical protein